MRHPAAPTQRRRPSPADVGDRRGNDFANAGMGDRTEQDGPARTGDGPRNGGNGQRMPVSPETDDEHWVRSHLERVYGEVLEEPLPQEFQALLARLLAARADDTNDGAGS